MIKKNFYLLILLFYLLAGCQGLRDGLEGNKKSKNAEEFLIQKKNPLVLPPDYSKLPLPRNTTQKEKLDQEYDFQKELDKRSNTGNKKKSQAKTNSNLEKSIIEKIQNK